MAAHHEPFKALAPIDWASIDTSDLPSLLSSTFAQAQTLIDSLPLPAPVASGLQRSPTGRDRAHTESAAVDFNRILSGDAAPVGSAAETAAKLNTEWKEVKVNPRDNPLGINVYKLAAKDGKGSWFARRSVHEGLGFDKWRLGLEREFAETLKASSAEESQPSPGEGNIRGIGAERRVEDRIVKGKGKLEVYQLSAKFPGPTAPREFVTLLLSSSSAPQVVSGHKSPKAPRQFMVISKPCEHPECPQRQGFIRGRYESVEIIREIPIDKPLRRVRSSIEINREDINTLSVPTSRDAVVRSARRAAAASEDDSTGSDGRGRAVSLAGGASTKSDVGAARGSSVDDSSGAGAPQETAIEWLMVTRSDPGGSVPRFMVEKGTPSGIVSDAGRLLKWLESKKAEDFDESADNDFKQEAVAADTPLAEQPNGKTPKRKPQPTGNLVPDPAAKAPEAPPSGFYNMIAGALGAAGSVVASRLPGSFGGSAKATDSEDVESDDSNSSSDHSFESAVEGEPPEVYADADATPLAEKSSILSTTSEDSTAPSATPTQHEKDLGKLMARRKKVQEKIARAQERALTRRQDDKKQDSDALAKLREKHEREMAKQEEKYQKELKKLEENRIKEERKAEERRKKAIEREERHNVQLELERVRSERDVALKQVDVLKEQVGDLQAQNTALVAKLGRMGVSKEDARADLKKAPNMEKKMAM